MTARDFVVRQCVNTVCTPLNRLEVLKESSKYMDMDMGYQDQLRYYLAMSQ